MRVQDLAALSAGLESTLGLLAAYRGQSTVLNDSGWVLTTMIGYRVWLERPVHSLHLAVQNLGRDLVDKEGVFTIRLHDESRHRLALADVQLPFSQRLDESYRYLMATRAGAPIVVGEVAATVPFQSLEVRYPGEFTDAPRQPADFGVLIYTLPTPRGCVLSIARQQFLESPIGSV